ncbi:MAG: trans-aconitate 2-methyltransferase [Bauldia sp.]
MTSVAANQRFLATKQSQSARDWDQLLAHQVDLLLADELPLLRSLPAWREARRVIDAGCGNGYYLSRVASFFPEKDYVGVDISKELIEAAREAHPEHAFAAGDFFAADMEPADVVIMRFLVQHLRDFRAVLQGAARALRPGGTLIIIESDMSRSEIRPIPGAFHRMLLAYHKASASEGSLKTELLTDVRKLICDADEPWSLAAEYEAHTSRVGPFDDGKLVSVFLKWVDLAERSAMFAFDFDSVRAELAQWSRNPAAFVSLATRLFVLEQRSLA